MKEIVIVDIETSGFQHQGGLIVEVGIVSLNLQTGQISNEFSEIIQENGFGEKHTRNPYGWIFKNSDLQYADVLRAGNLLELIPKINLFSINIHVVPQHSINNSILVFKI